jgi:hypothetical protein
VLYTVQRDVRIISNIELSLRSLFRAKFKRKYQKTCSKQNCDKKTVQRDLLLARFGYFIGILGPTVSSGQRVAYMSLYCTHAESQ